MGIVFTRHAEREMDRRGVLPAWAAETLATPWDDEIDPADPALRRAFRPIVAFGGRALRVVYAKDEDNWRVITVCWDRNRLRKWRREGRFDQG